MTKLSLWPVILLSLLLVGAGEIENPEDATEVAFKAVVIAIKGDPLASTRLPDPQWRQRLMKGMAGNTASKWTDDAAFLVHLLNSAESYLGNGPGPKDIQRDIEGLKSLVTQYPDFDVEPWSTANLPRWFRKFNATDGLPDNVELRPLLIMAYGPIGGDWKNANILCQETMAMSPRAAKELSSFCSKIEQQLKQQQSIGKMSP